MANRLSLTPELASAIADGLRAGLTPTRAASVAGVAHATLQNIIKRSVDGRDVPEHYQQIAVAYVDARVARDRAAARIAEAVHG